MPTRPAPEPAARPRFTIPDTSANLITDEMLRAAAATVAHSATIERMGEQVEVLRRQFTGLRESVATDPLPDLPESVPAPAYADAPTRPTAALDLIVSEGMVIPLSVYAGVEDVAIGRASYIHLGGDDFVRVGKASVRKDSGKLVDPNEILKMVETDDGLVELSDIEIEYAVGLPNSQAEVVEYLPLSTFQFSTYLPDSLYQVRPAATNRRGNPRPEGHAVNVAFDLFMRAMRVENVYAIVKTVLRAKPRYAALLPDGRFMTLRYDTEIRTALPMPEVEDPSHEDLMTMRMLIAARTANVPAPLIDNAGECLREFVQAKQNGMTLSPEPPLPPVSNVPNLMESLREQVRGYGLSPLNVPNPVRMNDIFDTLSATQRVTFRYINDEAVPVDPETQGTPESPTFTVELVSDEDDDADVDLGWDSPATSDSTRTVERPF